MKNKELRTRASRAFDAKFRDRLANAVQGWILGGGEIRKAPLNNLNCRCPEGCLTKSNYPGPSTMQVFFGFSHDQHFNFQCAFDSGIDNYTPESALGLLYRQRFIK